jgi:lipopolysaccharide export system protein LptA
MPMMLARMHAPLHPLSPSRSQAVLRAIVVLSVACSLGVSMAWADKADRAQPLNFAADNARVDDAQRLNILSGNVEITKGSIVLRADRVEVRQGNDGSQTAVATGGQGGRALFRQRREGLDELIEGEADRVEYDGRADVVRFNGRAVMRRLTGGVVADEVVGQTIVYDNKTEVFQVVGGGGSGSATPSGRVRGVIAPRKASGPADAASSSVRGALPGGLSGAVDSAALSVSQTLSQAALSQAAR